MDIDNLSKQRQYVLARTRKSFGKTTLMALDDEQALLFYDQLKNLLNTTNKPYGYLTDLVRSWHVAEIDALRPDTLRQIIQQAGSKLFGNLEKYRVKHPLIAESVDSLERVQKQCQRYESTQKQKIKAQFDPLAETVRAVTAFRNEFEFWASVGRENRIDPPRDLARLGNTWRESIKDAVELFRSLGLIDGKALEDMRERIHIDNLQLMVNQVESPENLGGLLGGFINEIKKLPAQELTNESGLCTADHQSRTGHPGLVEAREGTECEPIGIQDYRSLSEEPSPGDDGQD